MENYAILNEANVITNIFIGADPSELIDGIDPQTWYSNFNNKKCISTSDKQGVAAIGGKFNEEKNLLIPLSPFSSWSYNYSTLRWEAPSPKPEGDYWWDENNLKWEEDDKSDLI